MSGGVDTYSYLLVKETVPWVSDGSLCRGHVPPASPSLPAWLLTVFLWIQAPYHTPPTFPPKLFSREEEGMPAGMTSSGEEKRADRGLAGEFGGRRGQGGSDEVGQWGGGITECPAPGLAWSESGGHWAATLGRIKGLSKGLC